MYFPTSNWNHEATSCPSCTPPHLWEVLYSSPKGFYHVLSLGKSSNTACQTGAVLCNASSASSIIEQPPNHCWMRVDRTSELMIAFFSFSVCFVDCCWPLVIDVWNGVPVAHILVQRVDTWSGNRWHPIWISSPLFRGSQTLFATSPMSGTCDRSRSSISHTDKHVAHMRQRNAMNENWQTTSSNQRPLPQKRNGNCVGYGGGFMLRPCKDILHVHHWNFISFA